MKPRRVLLTLEVETDAPLEVLSSPMAYGEAKKGVLEIAEGWHLVKVLQAQANVIKPAPKRKRR